MTDTSTDLLRQHIEARAAELAAPHIAQAGVAAGREIAEAAEEHAAELAGRLAALRQTWVRLQQAEIFIRETADGPSAGAANSRAELIGRFLADLNQLERTYS